MRESFVACIVMLLLIYDNVFIHYSWSIMRLFGAPKLGKIVNNFQAIEFKGPFWNALKTINNNKKLVFEGSRKLMRNMNKRLYLFV